MSIVVDIKKTYSDFSLDIAFEAQSETLGFLGASGCGKSLTLRAIAGVETPDEGKIIVNGKTYFDKKPGQKATVNLTPQERKTALLFQNYQLFPNLTVGKNIAAGINQSLPKDKQLSIVAEQLKRFGLIGLEKRYPAQLSGGQQQRVALARMLAATPDILMLDEPFSALDAHLKNELEQNLIDLFSRYEKTILYVSHDIDEAFRFCDRIAVVDKGRLEEIADKHSLLNAPQSRAAMRLSGCKNTTTARFVNEHTVFLPDWDIEVETKHTPSDVAYLGVRASYLCASKELPSQTTNTFKVRVDRVSDSRFERSVMAHFITKGCAPASLKQESMEYFKTHIQWNVRTLNKSTCELPQIGDEFYLTIPADKIYLTTH